MNSMIRSKRYFALLCCIKVLITCVRMTNAQHKSITFQQKPNNPTKVVFGAKRVSLRWEFTPDAGVTILRVFFMRQKPDDAASSQIASRAASSAFDMNRNFKDHSNYQANLPSELVILEVKEHQDYIYTLSLFYRDRNGFHKTDYQVLVEVMGPYSPSPRITGFLKEDLVKPDEVKFNKKYDASKHYGFKIPCNATGSNLQWRWQHKGNDIVFPNAKYKLGDNGSLTGEYLEAENSGSYQCFVKDTKTKRETFSRKLQIKVTYIGDFTIKRDEALVVDLGDSIVIRCPPHRPNYGARYSWESTNGIQLKRDAARAISPEGSLFIMFVTQKDVDEIAGLKGIVCTIVGANTIYRSGFITLQKRAGSIDPGTTKSPSWALVPNSFETAVEGTQKTLYCLAVGRPAPNITWKKNGQQIIKGHNSFVIPHPLQGRHQDTYTCEAENSENSGRPLVLTINLKVEIAPRWAEGTPPPAKKTIDNQGSGTLLCNVEADPAPTYTWYFDGTKILSSTSKIIMNNNTLEFKDVDLAQDGVYQCVAESRLGMIVSSTWVYVRDCNSAVYVNQSAGLINVTHTDYKYHDCYWTIGNAGVSHAVALFLFQQLDFDYCSEYVKIFDDNGTVQFYQTGCWPSALKKALVEVPFGKSNNITVDILLSKLKSHVRIHFVVLQTSLSSAPVLPGWTVLAGNISTTSILIQWTNLTSLINQQVSYYVIHVNRTSGNALIQRITNGNRLYTEVSGLKQSTNYKIYVFGVDELGRPYRTLEINATTKNSPVVTSCNFDYGLCSGWKQSHSDVFDWTRYNGSSSNTGPTSDHTSGSGYYMYINTSSQVAGDNAKLVLSVSGNKELSCLTFYYHMYGNTMGTLNIYSGNAVVFNMSGNHGNNWLKANISIYLDNNVTFEGIVGSFDTGDLAIDDVYISSGSCYVSSDCTPNITFIYFTRVLYFHQYVQTKYFQAKYFQAKYFQIHNYS